jgi:pyruvate kinase
MFSLQVPLLKRRRTKIVATLGPASSDAATIEQLIRAGVNVFRLNMSHGSHAEHDGAGRGVRDAAARLQEPVALLADLCGPRIRVGRFASGKIDLETGSRVCITTRDVLGQPGLIPSGYEALARDVRPGNHVLLDDGLIDLQVEEVNGTEIACVVVQGGSLKDNKGMNLPGVKVSAPSLTAKDREDARFALDLGVDYLALSFVRQAADVAELKALVAASGASTHVIAKIEVAEALEALEEIVGAADGLMVARGDLGVELPLEVVPIAQRLLVARARAHNKPAIIATQMLESMVASHRPTRAEVSDVSAAVFSGADALMLSGETAVGAYPIRAVAMMDRIARQAESRLWAEGAFGTIAEEGAGTPPLPLHVAVARATAQLSRDLRVRTIVVLSQTGSTAGVVAAARPAAPIVALTTDLAACRRMSLLWGVVPIQVEAADLQQPHALACRVARQLELAVEGDFLLTVTGFGTSPATRTPTITTLAV